jgi:hypothetical protein
MPRFGDSVTASPLDSLPNGGSAKITLNFNTDAMFCGFTEMQSHYSLFIAEYIFC